MIGSNASSLVHRMRVAALEQNVGFRPDDVEGAGLRENLIEDVDVMYFAVGNADKRGDIAMQVEQRVHLDRAFVLAELRPRKQRKAQVDGGRIQRVQTLIQFEADWVGNVKRSGEADQDLGEVGVDSPIVGVVGIGQSGA